MHPLPRLASRITSPRIAPVVLAAAAGLTGFAPRAALAADCALAVEASPQVVYTGQSVNVNVFAQFPATTFAFASTQFDVFSTFPAWSFVTGGAVVGDDVLGITASQSHQPQLSQPANPANPFRVWRGVFTPTSNVPALVEIEADPTNFLVYPSKLTPSSAPCDAKSGSDYVLVNPLPAGRWAVAPGRGTEIAVHSSRGTAHDDVIVDGRIITAENPATPILIGMLLPAVQSCRDCSTRVGFDGPPTSFTATLQVDAYGRLSEDQASAANQGPQRTRVTSLSVTFNTVGGVPNPGQGLVYGVSAERSGPGRITFEAFRGGVRVALGDLNGDAAGQSTLSALVVPSVPPQALAKVGTGQIVLPAANSAGTTVRSAVWNMVYDSPTPVLVRGQGGQYSPVVADRIEVRTAIPKSAAGIPLSHNLRQIGIGCHTFEATGTRALRVIPSQPR